MHTDIVRGHEVWLEPTHLHFHTGGEIEVKALWGHMMRRDGMGRAEHWRCYALAPDGVRHELEPLPGEGLYHMLYLPAGAEGLYTVVVENDAGVFCTLPGGTVKEGSRREHPQALKCARYYQWARVTVPVGHDVHGHGVNLAGAHHHDPGRRDDAGEHGHRHGVAHAGRHEHVSCCHGHGDEHAHAHDSGHEHGHGVALAGGLDIVPAAVRPFHPGDSLDLQVLYRGRPLAGATVRATYHLFEGADYPRAGLTGPDGKVAFTFEQKGHWMFIVNHTDASGAVAGEYDGLELTATLVVPGVR
ncbi:DUF4198 domain-containing protein [Desulfotomaculum copahuensis]|uniref:Nickel transporter n=1 Tax=Desulfotomaculum copahuensis TaxID=1838280 RepID=A0A1B7LHN0_9FIRM|nr:DUF4198 domain-containing protein [Desulfotomaculum copahuensis]OAT85758.1 hypothetical protein A6M21_04475 [Desulfotomaculum copahuensis]